VWNVLKGSRKLCGKVLDVLSPPRNFSNFQAISALFGSILFITFIRFVPMSKISVSDRYYQLEICNQQYIFIYRTQNQVRLIVATEEANLYVYLIPPEGG